MVSLVDLWLPILLSAVGVFIASSLLHMLFKFWHQADYNAFANEEEVRAAIRRGSPQPGMYMVPFCTNENANSPGMRRKFEEGPVGIVFLRGNGMINMGATLALWFAFCVIVSLFVAYVASVALASTVDPAHIFRVIGVVTFMAYALGVVPYGIWWGQPWKAVAKDIVDGLIYAAITGAIFAWLWPAHGN